MADPRPTQKAFDLGWKMQGLTLEGHVYVETPLGTRLRVLDVKQSPIPPFETLIITDYLLKEGVV